LLHLISWPYGSRRRVWPPRRGIQAIFNPLLSGSRGRYLVSHQPAAIMAQNKTGKETGWKKGSGQMVCRRNCIRSGPGCLFELGAWPQSEKGAVG